MAKSVTTMDDEELAAEGQRLMAARAADDEKHRDALLVVREEMSRRAGLARATELAAQLAELPPDLVKEAMAAAKAEKEAQDG